MFKLINLRKAAGLSGVTAEMIKVAGEQAVDWLTSICNRIVKEEAIPESWQMSELVPIYKGKGDVLECSSSRGIKLLEHRMKVAERVLERRLRQAVEIDKMQLDLDQVQEQLIQYLLQDSCKTVTREI